MITRLLLLISFLLPVRIDAANVTSLINTSQINLDLDSLNYSESSPLKLTFKNGSILNQAQKEREETTEANSSYMIDKKTRRTHSAPIRLMAVGVQTNLEAATIEYASQVQLGEDNVVTVKTNPSVTGAAIYMNVTDLCARDYYNDCVRSSPGQPNYVTNSIRKKLIDNNNDGTYTGTYKITENSEGYITISLYVMVSGLRRVCYGNMDFSGSPSSTEINLTTYFNWGKGDVCPGYQNLVSSRWKGKLTITDSRDYDFRVKADESGKLFIDGDQVINAKYSYPLVSYPGSKFLSEGEHDIILEVVENAGDALYELDWSYPSSYVSIPLSVLSCLFSMHASPNIKATCREGYYIVASLGVCAKCPKGTYNNKTGQFFCELCPEGTSSDKAGQISINICFECSLMTYSDKPGLSRCRDCPVKTYSDQWGSVSCSPCHPLCSMCYGPYETQCHSCVQSSGIIFSMSDTCKCPDHQYYDISNNLCTACHPLCLSCFGGSSEECQDCNTTISYSIIDKPYTCIAECEDGYYKDSSTCKCIISSL